MLGAWKLSELNEVSEGEEDSDDLRRNIKTKLPHVQPLQSQYRNQNSIPTGLGSPFDIGGERAKDPCRADCL